MYCKNCGARISEESGACPVCGYRAEYDQSGYSSYQNPEVSYNYGYNYPDTGFTERQAIYEQTNAAPTNSGSQRQSTLIKVACACVALAVAVCCSLPFLLNNTSAKASNDPEEETITQQSSENTTLNLVAEKTVASKNEDPHPPVKLEIDAVPPPNAKEQKAETPKVNTTKAATTKAATTQADVIPSRDKSSIEFTYSNSQVTGAKIRLWGTYKELSKSDGVTANLSGVQYSEDCEYDRYYYYEFDLKNRSANVNVSEYRYDFIEDDYNYECITDENYYKSSYCSYSISHDYVDIYITFDRPDSGYDWDASVYVNEGTFRTQTGAINDWLSSNY